MCVNERDKGKRRKDREKRVCEALVSSGSQAGTWHVLCFCLCCFFLCLRASCLFQAGRQAGVPLKQDHSCGTGGSKGEEQKQEHE